MNAIVMKKLAPEEYKMLESAPDHFVPPVESSIVLAAMDGDKLVGRTCLLQMVHVEGTWVAESHRNGTVGARLLKGIEKEAVENGFKSVLAYAADEKVEGYLARLGYVKQPLTVWSKELI